MIEFEILHLEIILYLHKIVIDFITFENYIFLQMQQIVICRQINMKIYILLEFVKLIS